MGLDPVKHLGKEIAFLQPYLHKLNKYVSFISFSFLCFSSYSMLSFTVQVIYEVFLFLGRLYGINVCGEGGEYETLTLDCPLFIVRLSFISRREILSKCLFSIHYNLNRPLALCECGGVCIYV